jgi:hypothetical protein
MGDKPDHEDVAQYVAEVAKEHADLCRASVLGTSVEGLDIPCLTLTDPDGPDDDKQHVLVVAGQHGSEESGRAMALELIRWLTSGGPGVKTTLRNQTVAVVACANPDGASADTYHNADDVNMAHTYTLGGPAQTPEGRAIEAFALEFAPEVLVDIHGRAGGGMKDTIWLSPPLGFSPDRYFLTMMAQAMVDAAEQAGFPQVRPNPPGPFHPTEDSTLTLGAKLAAEVKALCFGMETIEQYYTEPEWRADGLARLARLLEFGNEDAFGLGEAGYPASLVSGNRVYGLKAHGTTAAERRASRTELTRFLRDNWAIVDRLSDGVEKCCKVKVMSMTVNGPNPERFAVLLRFKKPCEVNAVVWEDETLGEDTQHGYRIWEDDISLLMQVSLATPFGGPERWLTVEYDSPYI